MAESDPQLRVCIDCPPPGPVAARRALIRGWCYHAGPRRVVSLRAVNSREAQPARLGFDRRDVSAAHGTGAADLSGFTVAVRLPPGASSTRLIATLDDGSEQTAAVLELQAPAHGVFNEWIQSLRLALHTRLASPAGWDLLDQDERDFLLARHDQQGHLNIGRHVQYAPRPVEPECFPPPSPQSPADLPALHIAMPSRNQGAFLGDAVRSVLTQQGVRLALHVQDGASTDDSAAVLAALRETHASSGTVTFSSDSRPDAGQAAAIIAAFDSLSRAHTPAAEDVMAYLNSDDLYLPGSLRFVAEWFARHPRADVLYGHRVIVDEQGRETGRWLSPRRSCDDLRMQDLIPQECLFWRRRAWDRVGGIDPSFRFALDWDLLQRMEAAGLSIVRVPWFLGCFRMHPQQKTQAWMESDGTPEMQRLRTRAFGRPVTETEFRRSMTLGQHDSAWVCRQWRRGKRI